MFEFDIYSNMSELLLRPRKRSYVNPSLISIQNLYKISKEDFADHVRQVNTWKDLAIRCGCKLNRNGQFRATWVIPDLKTKASNMNLNIDHFHGQTEFPDDDVFIKMVETSDSYQDLAKKCVSASGTHRNRAYFNRRINDLCIDTSHWKITSIGTRSTPSKVNMIDDETFKMIVKNSINWTDLCHECGYKSPNPKDILIKRI